MKVSIVVPTYNNSKYLDRCVKSLVGQTYTNIEIIIVNDGSSDDTEKILTRWAMSEERVHIINQHNSGTHMSRVSGIKKATGDSILNMDSDDYLEGNAVELLVREMENSSSDVVVGNHFMHKHGRKIFIQNEIPEEYNQVSILKYLLLAKLTGYLWGRLIKRYLLEDLQLPVNRAYSEDVLTNFYIFSNHKIKLSIVKEGILHYIMHDTNVSNSDNSVVVEGFFKESLMVEKMLHETKWLDNLPDEVAAFNCRNWVVYCRKGGIKTKDKNYHKAFYKKNYPRGKKYLSFYQRIEMISYAQSIVLGKIISNLMKWGYHNLYAHKLIESS